MKRIARVFPRETKYTPEDGLAFTHGPDFFTPEVDEVHVSCVFTWDKPRAEKLARQWQSVCSKVFLGGPAYDDPGGEFTPGLYLKPGYVQTSRGCPRKCSFCFVAKREGRIRELAIHPGPWVLDNNLLACSRSHIDAVFAMLTTQRDVKFLGGLDARLMDERVVSLLAGLGTRLRYFYTAYDQPKQMEAVEAAIERCYVGGLSQKHIGCYVLVGYEGDMPEEANRRKW